MGGEDKDILMTVPSFFKNVDSHIWSPVSGYKKNIRVVHYLSAAWLSRERAHLNSVFSPASIPVCGGISEVTQYIIDT